MRGWLEPWVMLWRQWKAHSDLPPPKEVRVLLERVFSGRDSTPMSANKLPLGLPEDTSLVDERAVAASKEAPSGTCAEW